MSSMRRTTTEMALHFLTWEECIIIVYLNTSKNMRIVVTNEWNYKMVEKKGLSKLETKTTWKDFYSAEEDSYEHVY